MDLLHIEPPLPELEGEGMIHTLKTDSEVFQAVLLQAKTFEIRKHDRDFQVGDVLVLQETEHTGEEMHNGAPLEYTRREYRAEVTHILDGPIHGLAAGWCILSIKEV